jgi:hypothetical protein
MVREDEGLTVVLPRERADALGLDHQYVAAGSTCACVPYSTPSASQPACARLPRRACRPTSSPAITTRILLVPADRAAAAIEVLTGVSQRARR